MPSKKKLRKQPINQQMSLIGDIFNYELKYKPQISTSDTGESVVVLRLPPEATESERIASYDEMHRMALSIKCKFKPEFYNKKPRDGFRKKALHELTLDDVNNT